MVIDVKAILKPGRWLCLPERRGREGDREGRGRQLRENWVLRAEGGPYVDFLW